MEKVVTKFVIIGSVASAVLAGLLAIVVSAQAETRDHRGQPKQVAAPTCIYVNRASCIPLARFDRAYYCAANPGKCTDHRTPAGKKQK
jgi:hypothetical protein